MQNYKLYINEKPLYLTSSAAIPFLDLSRSKMLVGEYPGKKKFLFHYIDTLEKPSKYDGVILHCKDFKKLKKDFKSLFSIVTAAGGLVVTPGGEVLFIYRRGFWDLPKGKLDSGESKKRAALREVREETGVKKLHLGPKLVKTRHMYRSSGKKRLMKVSHWYLMFAEKTELSPQFEEDIEIAEWHPPIQFLKKSPQMYESIKDVLRAYFNYKLEMV